ncbi:hypothetical protein KY345_02520 [Candidatus Woesearchaeota archaeon]|nr:hypothetical protein [Candidatus Woesearchaeota archaeon]
MYTLTATKTETGLDIHLGGSIDKADIKGDTANGMYHRILRESAERGLKDDATDLTLDMKKLRFVNHTFIDLISLLRKEYRSVRIQNVKDQPKLVLDYFKVGYGKDNLEGICERYHP